MKQFAHLLDRLSYTASRNTKLDLLVDFFRTTPDPERGIALAAITRELNIKTAKPALIREMITARMDETLFKLSYDYVGDLAETVALLWDEDAPADAPADGLQEEPPSLTEAVEQLNAAKRTEVEGLLTTWLNQLDADGRWALLKVLTGGLRIGVSARLAKQSVAQLGGLDISEIEELWHGLEPPYESLFAWAEGRVGKPDIDQSALFKPLMLANPLEEPDYADINAADFAAEYKWDGIRVQLVGTGDRPRLYSRAGDDISRAFPDVLTGDVPNAVLDGELLVVREGKVAPFNDLQQRLNRKTVTKKMLVDYPAHIRCYDLLFDGERDLRREDFRTRRAVLDGIDLGARFDKSQLVPFADFGDLADHRESVAEDPQIEGLMLKRWDSPYLVGRPKGYWYKWKRAALTLDLVLMYAQRGHGKRSSFYSDYTFGALVPASDVEGEAGRNEPGVVPVGKAYSGFTDQELKRIDKYVRENTIDRFGPVRSVKLGLVLEIAFDSVHVSSRHKSGVAMRFPRVHRLRWDKPWQEADSLENVQALIRA